MFDSCFTIQCVFHLISISRGDMTKFTSKMSVREASMMACVSTESLLSHRSLLTDIIKSRDVLGEMAKMQTVCCTIVRRTQPDKLPLRAVTKTVY
jgi:hypothetical protein